MTFIIAYLCIGAICGVLENALTTWLFPDERAELILEQPVSTGISSILAPVLWPIRVIGLIVALPIYIFIKIRRS